MGEIIDVAAELRIDNPALPSPVIQMYADALDAYVAASANIKANGAICLHPRTGQPIENPYVKIQCQYQKTIASMRQVNADRVFHLLFSVTPPQDATIRSLPPLPKADAG